MALSTLTVATPKPYSLQLQTSTSKYAATTTTTTTTTTMVMMNFKASSSAASPQHNSTATVNKNRILQLGAGFLAATMVVLSPMDADATRLNYYATVADPSCDLTYARSGLGYCDLDVGSGVQAPRGELINIHYTARFADGTVFDSSYKRGRPLTMRIGVSKVIKGLDQGIMGGDELPPMRVGGKRKLVIPPHLAYGPEPAGCFSGDCNVPGNATLVYDIKFVELYSGNRKLN